MKYNELQKKQVVIKGLNIRREAVYMRNLINSQFPIKVEIQGEYFVVESKINFELPIGK